MARGPSNRSRRATSRESKLYKNVHRMKDGYWQAWVSAWTPADYAQRIEEREERAARGKNGRFIKANSSNKSGAGASSSNKRKAGGRMRLFPSVGQRIGQKQRLVEGFNPTRLGVRAGRSLYAAIGKKRRGSRGRYVGRYDTERLAARAQDRGLMKVLENSEMIIEGTLNFPAEDYVADRRLRAMLEDEEFFWLLRSEARPTYKRVEQTQLLKEFCSEEKKVRKITKGQAPKPLRQFLLELFKARKGDVILPEDAKRLIKRYVAKPTSNVKQTVAKRKPSLKRTLAKPTASRKRTVAKRRSNLKRAVAEPTLSWKRTGLRSSRRRLNPSVGAVLAVQIRADA